MFDDVIEAQQNTGLRGILNRHFGRIDNAENALKAVQFIARFFLWFALITAIIGLVFVGPSALIDAMIYAGLSFWLLRRKSRIAACLLVIMSMIPIIVWAIRTLTPVLNPFGGGNIFIMVVIFAAAWRGAYATFRFYGNWKEAGSDKQP